MPAAHRSPTRWCSSSRAAARRRRAADHADRGDGSDQQDSSCRTCCRSRSAPRCRSRITIRSTITSTRSRAAKTFEIPLYKGEQAPPVRLRPARRGQARLQHPRLDVGRDPGRADAVLRQSPTRAGAFTLRDVPPGTLRVVALARGQQDAAGRRRAQTRRRRRGAPPLTFTLDVAPRRAAAGGAGAELRMSSWWARRRLRTRRSSCPSRLILAILLATLWVIGAAVGGWVERQPQGASSTVTGNVFRESDGRARRRLRGETDLLVRDFALKRAIATYDPDTLASVAVNHRERYRHRPAVDHRRERQAARRLRAERVPQRPSPVGTCRRCRRRWRCRDAMAARPAGDHRGRRRLMRARRRAGVGAGRPDRLPARRRGDRRRHRASSCSASTGPAVSFAHRDARSSPRRGRRAARDAALPGRRGGRAGRSRAASAAPAPRRGDVRSCQLGGERLALQSSSRSRRALPEPLFALVQDSYDHALGPLAALPRRVGGIGAAGARSARCWSAA